MWIIQKPKKVALWNRRHFEEKTWECAKLCTSRLIVILRHVDNYFPVGTSKFPRRLGVPQRRSRNVETWFIQSPYKAAGRLSDVDDYRNHWSRKYYCLSSVTHSAAPEKGQVPRTGYYTLCLQWRTVQPQSKDKCQVPATILSVFSDAQYSPRERTSAKYRLLYSLSSVTHSAAPEKGQVPSTGYYTLCLQWRTVQPQIT